MKALRAVALDLFAIACLVAFAAIVWWPSSLLVLAAASLWISWRRS